MRVLFAFLALTVVAAMGVGMTNAALSNAGEQRTVTNESFTPDAGNVTTLDESNRAGAIYDDQVRVETSDGTVAVEGEDYIWYEQNGTIKTISGGLLDGKSEAYIEYGYSATSEQQRRLAGLAAQLPKTVGLLLPVGMVLAFIAALRG